MSSLLTRGHGAIVTPDRAVTSRTRPATVAGTHKKTPAPPKSCRTKGYERLEQLL
jgi:hypothetical protein